MGQLAGSSGHRLLVPGVRKAEAGEGQVTGYLGIKSECIASMGKILPQNLKKSGQVTGNAV